MNPSTSLRAGPSTSLPSTMLRVNRASADGAELGGRHVCRAGSPFDCAPFDFAPFGCAQGEQGKQGRPNAAGPIGLANNRRDSGDGQEESFVRTGARPIAPVAGRTRTKAIRGLRRHRTPEPRAAGYPYL